MQPIIPSRPPTCSLARSYSHSLSVTVERHCVCDVLCRSAEEVALVTRCVTPFFSHDVEQLVELLMHVSARRWFISFQNTRAKSEDSQF